MQAGFLRLFGRRERDEKEELPLEFSLRILLNPKMLSCSLNLLQSQIDGAASIAALLRSVKNAGAVEDQDRSTKHFPAHGDAAPLERPLPLRQALPLPPGERIRIS